MDIKSILDKYDAMYGVSTPEERYDFLVKTEAAAEAEGDFSSLLTLLNERIGLCRDMGKKEEGIECCEKTMTLLTGMSFGGSGCGQMCPTNLRSQSYKPSNDLAYATSLINIATAYREFGKYRESEIVYKDAESVFNAYLEPDDARFAALYNNESLLYQAMGDLQGAYEKLMQAKSIVDNGTEYTAQATTRVNLALVMMGQGRSTEETGRYLQEAITIFEGEGIHDLHYGAALSALGDLKAKEEQYADAAKYYEKALAAVEKFTAHESYYKLIKEKYDHARSKIS
ncbi:MAG: tetratricopeptide repeat protein [Lachnospiraceae bacterium]|nr:tetratricopeptide repeat protein [Lachnospiraceae bacterium]